MSRRAVAAINDNPGEAVIEPADVLHVAFNPQPLGVYDSPLQRITDDWGRGGWTLLRVVPHHQYESVAVFVKDQREADRG